MLDKEIAALVGTRLPLSPIMRETIVALRCGNLAEATIIALRDRGQMCPMSIEQ